MKFKSLLEVFVAGMVCLPLVGSGQSDIAARRQQAEQGHALAQYNLGVSYTLGDGVPINTAEAVKWYRRAAEQGFARAQCNLGSCYYNGQGVPQNYKEAVKWFRLAAEQGDADAQGLLSSCYALGEGVRRDDVQAYAWMSVAAAQRLENAANMLAMILEGMTPKQMEAAIRLSREYAEKYIKK